MQKSLNCASKVRIFHSLLPSVLDWLLQCFLLFTLQFHFFCVVWTWPCFFGFHFQVSTTTTIGFELWSQLCLWGFGFTPHFSVLFGFQVRLHRFLLPRTSVFYLQHAKAKQNKMKEASFWSIYLTGKTKPFFS